MKNTRAEDLLIMRITIFSVNENLVTYIEGMTQLKKGRIKKNVIIEVKMKMLIII